MCSNSFAAFADVVSVPIPPVKMTSDGIETLRFECDPSTVGALVGKRWVRVKNLASKFQLRFPGFDIDVSHDGEAFSVVLPAIDDAFAFIHETFGEEIAIANHGIPVRSEFVGRIIGHGGHNLRALESGVGAIDGCAGCRCTVYHDDERFWVRFPSSTPVEQRKIALAYIEARIFEHADYLEEKLTDAYSTVSDTSSVCSSAFSESSGATSVPCSDYSDAESWPELRA